MRTDAPNDQPGLSFRAVGRSAVILTGSAAGVQLVGVVREVFVAAQIGLSSSYDALLIALILPTTLAAILTAGTGTALVPAYLEVRERRGQREALRLAGTIGVWIGVAGLVTWVLLELAAALLMGIVGPGLGAGARDSGIAYLRVLAPLALVSALSGVLYAVCQAEERFGAIAWSSFVGAVVTLVTTLALWGQLGLDALAIGNLLGPLVAGVLLLGAAIAGGVAPRPALWTSRDELEGFVRHAAPLTVSSAVMQLNGISDRAIASLIAPGAVSALRYADVLVRTPIGAISPAWGTALYPSLVRAGLAAGTGLSNAVERSVRYVVALFMPVAALTMAVAPTAVAVGYGRGAFSPADVTRTAQAVAAFAPLIVLLMCYAPLVGALNARRRGGSLLAAGLISVVTNFVFDVVGGILLGAPGVALSSSLSTVLVVTFFVWRIRSIEPDFHVAPTLRAVAISAVACLPVAVPIAFASWAGYAPVDLAGGLAALVVFGVIGLAGYLAAAVVFGLDEARTLVDLFVEWRARRRHVADA